MKIMLIVIAVLVALVGVMFVIGAMLRVDHVASRTLRFSKTPAELFADVEKQNAEQTDVPFEVIERGPPTKLVTKIKPGQPFGGTWTYEIALDGEGSMLTITERGEVYNPLFRFLSRFVFGHYMTIDGFMKRLASR